MSSLYRYRAAEEEMSIDTDWLQANVLPTYIPDIWIFVIAENEMCNIQTQNEHPRYSTYSPGMYLEQKCTRNAKRQSYAHA